MIKKTSLHLFGTNVISHFPCLLHLHFLFLSSSPEMNFLPIQMKKAFSQGHFLQCWFLGAFAKLRKRLSASSYLSVRPQKTTRLPLEGFPWKSMFEHFRKSATNKLKFFFFKYDKNQGHFACRPKYVDDNTSLVLFRMKNMSDTSGEKINPHFFIQHIFLQIVSLWGVWTNIFRAGQATDDK